MVKSMWWFLSLLAFLCSWGFGWEQNYASALENSKKEGKCLLLFFTGSDWSGLSMKMKKEILDTKEFAQKSASNFLVLEIDFPKHRSLEPRKKEENEKLKEKFQIDEFPSLVLLDNQEHEIVRFGYSPESSKQLVKDLVSSIEQDRKISEGLKKLDELDAKQLRLLYQLAQELHHREALEKILAAGLKSDDSFFLLEKYRVLVAKEGSDTTGAGELRSKLQTFQAHQIQYTVAMIEFQEKAKLLAQASTPEEMIKPLAEYLEKYGKDDQENAWRIEMMMAQCLLEGDEWEQSLKHAESAYRLAPQEMQDEIQRSIDYIKRSHQPS